MTKKKLEPTYKINTKGIAFITCLLCNKTSYNPKDIIRLYCGFCHHFHEDEMLKRKNDLT